MSKYIIELKKLKKYYGTSRGIDDVTFSLEKGTIYGFIGPNGAGKSTTLRTIIGLINKTSGEILFEGESFNPEDELIKSKIGYLPSEVNLYKDMTVKEALDYHESFYRKNIHKRRNELVKELKVDENKKIGALSMGNLKKVGIVLALMHEPELLILDEPTNGLDPIIQNVLHNILLKEKEKGTTILYSSHVLSEVSSICDRVGFIKDGKLIHEDLIDNIKKDNFTYLTIYSDEINNIKKELKFDIVQEKDNMVKFINKLDADSLIKKLNKFHIDKILIEDVSLEDYFMNYYK